LLINDTAVDFRRAIEARIFGENNYSIVDHVERLPERLLAVFAALTG